MRNKSPKNRFCGVFFANKIRNNRARHVCEKTLSIGQKQVVLSTNEQCGNNKTRWISLICSAATSCGQKNYWEKRTKNEFDARLAVSSKNTGKNATKQSKITHNTQLRYVAWVIRLVNLTKNRNERGWSVIFFYWFVSGWWWTPLYYYCKYRTVWYI